MITIIIIIPFPDLLDRTTDILSVEMLFNFLPDLVGHVGSYELIQLPHDSQRLCSEVFISDKSVEWGRQCSSQSHVLHHRFAGLCYVPWRTDEDPFLLESGANLKSWISNEMNDLSSDDFGMKWYQSMNTFNVGCFSIQGRIPLRWSLMVFITLCVYSWQFLTFPCSALKIKFFIEDWTPIFFSLIID